MTYLNYKLFDDFWIKEIPDSWNTEKMKYMFDEISDKNHPDEVPLVASQHMGVVPKTVYALRTVEATKGLENFKLVKVGDFVISLRSFQGGLEYAYYQGIISPAYTILRSRGKIELNYYKYLAKSYPYISLLKTCVTGIREGQNIDYATLKNHLMPIPSKDEQDQIVRYLDWKTSEMNHFIHEKKKQIKMLKELRKNIICQYTHFGLIERLLSESEYPWIEGVPEGWEETKLKYVLRKLTHEARPEDELLICSNKGTVFPRGDSKMGLIAEDESIYQGVRTGDLLIHGMDTWHGAIGISEMDGKCTKVVHVCDTDQNKRYIMYYLQSLAFKDVYKKITNGVRENTSDFRSWDKAGTINLLLPPIEEQNEIAEAIDKKLSEIDNLINNIELEISYVEEIKTKLISDAVTGQIDVRDVVIPDYIKDEDTLDEDELEESENDLEEVNDEE